MEETVNPWVTFDCNTLAAKQGLVIGIDEAGRGALAGPVTAAALCLSRQFYRSEACRQYIDESQCKDSKQLSIQRRETLLSRLNALHEQGSLAFAHGMASVEEIEKFNILGATRIAMVRALDQLALTVNEVFALSLNSTKRLSNKKSIPVLLIDGRPLKPFPYTHRGVVQGDKKSLAIAAASIVAKVTRDQTLIELDKQYPQYGFAQHKGYGTATHRRAILKHGASPIHRTRFLRKLNPDKQNRL